MQIKYIKDAPLGETGDIAEVVDSEAQILITLGYAKEHKPRSKSDKTDTQNDLLTDQNHTTDSE